MNRRILLSLFLFLFPTLLLAQQTDSKAAAPPAPTWAIAIHGGAGTIPKDLPEAQKQQYLQSLGEALEIGQGVLAKGGTSLDAVEKVVRFLEDDPLFNAGKGAVYTHEKTHELDAAIMDGRDLSCGSVAALKTVKNPISLARLVKEKSPHVFLVGDGAEVFATEMKVERVPNSYFDTAKRLKELQDALKEEPQGAWHRGGRGARRPRQPGRRHLDRRPHQQALRPPRRRAGDRRRHLRQQPHLRHLGDRHRRGVHQAHRGARHLGARSSTAA